jgi:hypothetical protein
MFSLAEHKETTELFRVYAFEAKYTGVYAFNHHKCKLLKTSSAARFNQIIRKCDDLSGRVV